MQDLQMERICKIYVLLMRDYTPQKGTHVCISPRVETCFGNNRYLFGPATGISFAHTLPMMKLLFSWRCLANVMHGATFPVYDWQKFLTHPFADFFSLPWEEFVLEHNRHHASTVDLLIQGEFGWDPEVGLSSQSAFSPSASLMRTVNSLFGSSF